MQARTDRSLIRAAGESRRYLFVSFRAPAGRTTSQRLPVSIALVLDRSGSMGGGKFELVRVAAKRALQMLNRDDRFSVVVFDGRIDVLVESTPADVESVARAEALLAETEPRGSTDLFTGWMRGCEQVAAAAAEEGISKCLLLTDGLANTGVRDPGEIAGHAERLRELNVRTSTFGVGARFDERLLDRMAKAGGGHFYFIESAREIPELIASELGETLEIVARDARIELDLDPGVHAEMLSDFASVAPRSNAWRLGDLVSGQEVSILFAMTFQSGSSGDGKSVSVRLVSSDEAELPEADVEMSWTVAGQAENDAQSRDVEVDRMVAHTYAARARRDALEANRAGDFERARSILQTTAERIRSYAGADRELLAIAESLDKDQRTYRRSIEPLAAKRLHYDSANLLKSRDPKGRSRRGSSERDWLPLDTASGHPIALIDGVHALIDTGSPVSFGRPVHLLGFDDRRQAAMGPIDAREISRLVGTRVDALLGTDILARHAFVIDWSRGRIRFSRDPIGLPGRTVEAPLRLGVPCLELTVASKPGRAFLDTGAQLSYLDPATVNGTLSTGERDDFFPVIGAFRTKVYRQDVAVAGIALRLDFGVLPEALGMILGLSGIAWLVGNEVLHPHPVAFNLAQGTITFGES